MADSLPARTNAQDRDHEIPALLRLKYRLCFDALAQKSSDVLT